MSSKHGGSLVLCVVAAAILTGCSNEAALRRNLQNGQQFLTEGRVPEAIVEFRNAVDRDENSGEARLKLAEAYAANGEPQKAYREYVRAADLLPDDTTAQLKAATYLVLVGQYEDARTRVQRLLEKQPTNVDALILLGNALAGLRDLEGAVTQIREAVQLDPSRSQTYTNLALFTAAQGDRTAARAAFERAVQTDPRSIGARLALANFLWAEGDTAAAEASLQAALKIDANDVLTNRALATFYVASGRAPAAEPHLKIAAAASKTPASQLELADYYILLGRRAEASRVLEPMAVQSANAGPVEVRLAGIAYAAGQSVDAHARIDRLLRRQPDDPLALLLKARWLMMEGQLERALALATRAIAVDPRMLAAHYIRGQLQLATHRSGDAIKSFTEVLRLNPQATVAQVQLSRLHLARNAVDTAVLFAEEALRVSPTSVDARLALTRAWVARDDVDRAEAGMAQMRKESPDVAEVHSLDGSMRLLRADLAGARVAFVRALQLDGGDLEALNGLTTIEMRERQVERARELIEARLQAGRHTPDLLLLAAKVFIAADDTRRAEALLRQAIELDPLHTDTYVLLGRIYTEQNRVPAVQREFDDLARQQPKNLAAQVMAAMLVHAQGNVAEATKRYEAILAAEPRITIAANNLASIYAEAGENLEVAQRWAETAAEQVPMHAEIQDTLGMVYYRRHRYGEALRRFEQSVALEPGNAVYRYHLALVHARNGDVDRAREALRVALERRPDYDEARKALASLN